MNRRGRRRAKAAVIVSTLGIALLLAGCGSSASSSQTTVTPGTVAASTDTTTSTTSASSTPASVSGQVTFNDQQGYSYSLTYTLSAQAPSIDSHLDPPTSATVLLPASGNAVLTFTTPGGRVGPDALGSVAVYGLYKDTRPVCASTSAANISVSLKSPAIGPYCALEYARTLNGLSVTGLSAGQSVSSSLQPYVPSQDLGSFPNQDLVVHTTQSAVNAVVTDFAAGPDLWVVGTGTAELEASEGCQIGFGAVLIQAVDPGTKASLGTPSC